MKKTVILSACALILSVGSMGFAQAQTSGSVAVAFQGPGGHSSANYGRTSALHAAGHGIVALQKTDLPEGSYVVQNFRGGNSVNSIAGDAAFELLVTANDVATYQQYVTLINSVMQQAAKQENDFRGVQPGDTTAGVPADVRVTVQAKN